MISRLEEVPVAVRSMTYDDLVTVSDIERRSYEFPWSHGVFRDCMLAGYGCVVLDRGSRVVGYSVLLHCRQAMHMFSTCALIRCTAPWATATGCSTRS
ncbi:MAG: hypothetical protein U5K38_17350 [Woeseiaceae bacterium]|nr:hypothetical protein [Woeseiaceae bacterium]